MMDINQLATAQKKKIDELQKKLDIAYKRIIELEHGIDVAKKMIDEIMKIEKG